LLAANVALFAAAIFVVIVATVAISEFATVIIVAISVTIAIIVISAVSPVCIKEFVLVGGSVGRFFGIIGEWRFLRLRMAAHICAYGAPQIESKCFKCNNCAPENVVISFDILAGSNKLASEAAFIAIVIIFQALIKLPKLFDYILEASRNIFFGIGCYNVFKHDNSPFGKIKQIFFRNMEVFFCFCDHLLECEFLFFDVFEIKISSLILKHHFIAVIIVGLNEFHNKAVANEDFQLCI
jgi:hypothetical protein